MDQNSAKGEQTELFQAEASTWRPRLPSDPGSCQIGLHEKEAACLVEVFRHYETPIVYLGYSLWRKMLTMVSGSEEQHRKMQRDHSLPGLRGGVKQDGDSRSSSDSSSHPTFGQPSEKELVGSRAGISGSLNKLEQILGGEDFRAKRPTAALGKGFEGFRDWAIRNNQADVVSILIQQEVLIPSMEDQFLAAANVDSVHLLKLLLNDNKLQLLDVQDGNQQTLLHFAVKGDNLSVVKYLISQEPLLVSTRSKFNYPVHYVKSKVAVEFLIEHGAEVVDNVDGRSKWTPLHYLMAERPTKHGKEIGAAEALISHGVKLDLQNSIGDTPMHLASYYQHAPQVALLLDHGANPNLQSQRGYTPLHEASAKGHVDVVKLLLARGANAELKDKNGKSAKEVASSGVKELF